MSSDASAPAGAVLVATRNAGKLRELRGPLEALGYRVLDLTAAGVQPSADEEDIEPYDTFEQNAVAKARFYSAASGGLPTIADDSGLSVDALGGAPGVRSHRWSGVTGAEEAITAANNAKLLEVLSGASSRSARFVCVVAYVAGAAEVVERGETTGRIALAPRGVAGFGYDPLFESEDLGWRTFGEVTPQEKARVSHRARALAALYRRLQGQAAGPG